ncbi:hypothetical protein [Streptomyces sp. NPDC058394]|uniref:hypothetical protein n=1 Tax=Streptomyces sp. NPDC058394 TaxID=3346477 RepID=UPI0036573937
MQKYADHKLVKSHPGNVATFGATEPVLTVLDVRGFEIRDLFLIGFNDSCGTLIVPTESRAQAAQAALEPAFNTTVKPFGPQNGDWAVEYTRRDIDGSEPNRFLTNVTLKDGTVALRGGRWVR